MFTFGVWTFIITMVAKLEPSTLRSLKEDIHTVMSWWTVRLRKRKKRKRESALEWKDI